MPSLTLPLSCHCTPFLASFTIPTSSLPLAVHFCHCSICRHTHGTLFSIHARVPKPNVDFNRLTKYKSSERVVRWFCETCGAHVLDCARGEVEGKGGEGDRDRVGGGSGIGEEEEEEEKESWCVAVSLADADEGVWDFQQHIFVGGTGDGGLAGLLLQDWNGKKLKLWRERPTHDTRFSETGDMPLGTDERVPLPTPTQTAVLTAQCHCAGVSFTIARPTGPETFAGMHDSAVPNDKNKFLALHDTCHTCRQTSSSFLVSWIQTPRACIMLPDGSEYPANGLIGTAKLYNSSEGVQRTFCGRCGATVTYSCAGQEGMVDIAAGLVIVGGDRDGSDSSGVRGVRAEEWLEWRRGKVAWREDAVWKGMLGVFERRLQSRGEDGAAGSRL